MRLRNKQGVNEQRQQETKKESQIEKEIFSEKNKKYFSVILIR